MYTRRDFEILITSVLHEGQSARLPMASEKEFNSQRVLFSRTLHKLKKGGELVDFFSCKKITDKETIYLEITHKVHSNPTVLIKGENGEFQEITLHPDIMTPEEQKFAEWMKSVPETPPTTEETE